MVNLSDISLMQSCLFTLAFPEVTLGHIIYKLQCIYHAGQTITGGKVIIEVSYFGFHVHTETHNLSEEMSCPIAVGNFELSHTQTLPLYTPPVSFTVLD